MASRLFALVMCVAWVSGSPENIASPGRLSRVQHEKEILKDIFSLNKFNMLTRPPPPSNSSQNTPLEVKADYWILDIPEISESKNEFQIQMYLREEWLDERLAFENRQGSVEYVSTNDVTGFWVPDLFSVNEKSGHFHTITKPNSFMRIYPNGRVLYSQRLSLTIGCIMDLKLYPFDSQNCPIHIESYGYNAKEVRLQWKKEEWKQVDRVSSTTGYTVFQNNEYCHVKVGENEYSCLKLDLTIIRHKFLFMVKFFLPFILLVITSWITFWLSAKAVLARMTISVTTVACTVLHLCVFKRYFLPVSYFTALDIWTGASSIYIFIALFENALVCSKQKTNEDEAFKTEAGIENSSEKLTSNESGEQLTAMRYLMARLTGRPLKADVIARVLLPLSYVFFNTVYAVVVVCISRANA